MRISIEGIMGSGKTTILNLLAELGYKTQINDMDRDVWTELYNLNPERYSLGFNLNLLFRFNKDGDGVSGVSSSVGANSMGGNGVGGMGGLGVGMGGSRGSRGNDICLYENSPYTIQHVWAPLLLNKNLLHHEEYKLQKELVNKYLWKPDCIIYLDCSPETVATRIENVDKGEIYEFLLQYDWALEYANCNIPIYRVNANDNIINVFYHILQILLQIQKHNNFTPSITYNSTSHVTLPTSTMISTSPYNVNSIDSMRKSQSHPQLYLMES